MRIALCQFNPTVGDIEANKDEMAAFAESAARRGADVVVFPEQAITGYPAEDLLYRADFVRAAEAAVAGLDQSVPEGVTIIAGTPIVRTGAVYNAAAVVMGRLSERYLLPPTGLRAVPDFYAKQHLPNYGVFDENRYFVPGDSGLSLILSERNPNSRLIRNTIKTNVLGLSVCEDIWQPNGPALDSALAGANVMVNLSASPYAMGKPADRLAMLKQRARDTVSWIVYCNMVGGQDELVFDGNSVVIDHTGRVVAQAKSFREDVLMVDIDAAGADAARMRDMRFQQLRARSSPSVRRIAVVARHSASSALPLDLDQTMTYTEMQDREAHELYSALVLGTRDYVRKNGMEKVVIGVSGGIDSALVLNIAADALGPENVLGVTMPTDYNSNETLHDAFGVCRARDVECIEIPIQSLVESYSGSAVHDFSGAPYLEDGEDHRRLSEFLTGVAGENLQARIRGNVLMAISNTQDRLVLSCGNKSEMSMGYATLYGDMVGGFNPIKDVSKTWVYRLCHYLNTGEEQVPVTIIERPPSAELAPDQKDTDSLPPYEQLDPLLTRYIELDEDIRGTEVGHMVASTVDFNEYKRRQAPPGVKVTGKAFGRDRRLPITNQYRGPA